jgi:SH3-like domain-containing protein
VEAILSVEGRLERTPVQIVDELQEWLRTKIGDVAEDDWLLLGDFDGHCEAVRREWARSEAMSVANPDVKRRLQKRCDSNLRLAQTAFEALVKAWIARSQP